MHFSYICYCSSALHGIEIPSSKEHAGGYRRTKVVIVPILKYVKPVHSTLTHKTIRFEYSSKLLISTALPEFGELPLRRVVLDGEIEIEDIFR